MGIQQFGREVTGDGGSPVTTAPNGTLQTDNFEALETFDVDGANYPYSFDPNFTIQEIVLIDVDDIDAKITTTGGDIDVVRVKSRNLALNFLTIDVVEFQDPRGTAAPLTGVLIGE